MRKQFGKTIWTAVLAVTLAVGLTGCGTGSGKAALEKVKEAKVLKVAMSPDYAPYEFEDPSKSGQDTYAGADVALAQYLAQQLGVSCEIVPMDFDACLAGVSQGKADCSISALYPNEERKRTVDFTNAYFDDSRQCIVIKKENLEQFQTEEDLAGQKIAAQNGSVQADITAEKFGDGNMQLINKATDGIQMVKSGKVAGIMLQGVMAESVAAADDSLAICKVEFTHDEAELVVAVKKGEEEFAKELNRIIADVNEQKLYEQWLVEAQNLFSSMNQ